jgi:hypothetical protein
VAGGVLEARETASYKAFIINMLRIGHEFGLREHGFPQRTEGYRRPAAGKNIATISPSTPLGEARR